MPAGWECTACGAPVDGHHEWYGCRHPEPGMTTTSGVHALIVTGAPDDPEVRVLHPAGCTTRTCPVMWELDQNGVGDMLCTHPTWSNGRLDWHLADGVYLVTTWAVAGTRSQFALSPMEWDGGTIVHATAVLPDTSALDDLASWEASPWQ